MAVPDDRIDATSERSDSDGDSVPAEVPAATSRAGSQALLLIGFVTLGAELWLGRAVAQVVGSDALGLSLSLGAFLLGSAAGSAFASSPPSISAAARVMAGRIRFPPARRL